MPAIKLSPWGWVRISYLVRLLHHRRNTTLALGSFTKRNHCLASLEMKRSTPSRLGTGTSAVAPHQSALPARVNGITQPGPYLQSIPARRSYQQQSSDVTVQYDSRLLCLLWTSRSRARSSGTVRLRSGSCTGSSVWSTLLSRAASQRRRCASHFASIKLGKGLSPSSDQTCPVHTPNGRPGFLRRPHLTRNQPVQLTSWSSWPEPSWRWD